MQVELSQGYPGGGCWSGDLDWPWPLVKIFTSAGNEPE
jgi:hypothetical protein